MLKLQKIARKELLLRQIYYVLEQLKLNHVYRITTKYVITRAKTPFNYFEMSL